MVTIVPTDVTDHGTAIHGGCVVHVNKLYSVEMVAYASEGSDGAVVVEIVTSFEPDGSDGPGLRVYVNDELEVSGVSYKE